jgi:hypothetical protein
MERKSFRASSRSFRGSRSVLGRSTSTLKGVGRKPKTDEGVPTAIVLDENDVNVTPQPLSHVKATVALKQPSFHRSAFRSKVLCIRGALVGVT